jgi:predicted TIM-barrel fold metal-dependent hydrolase
MRETIAGETGHIVISADSHTEGLVDLKPYLESKYHACFDDGLEIARHTFTNGVGFFYNMVESLAITEVEDEDSTALFELPEMDRFHHGDLEATVEEYLKPWPIEERLKALDDDGVAAEFITPFVGSFSKPIAPDFMHAQTLAFDRWCQHYFSPAPHRFTAAAAVNLVCPMEQVVAEIEHAYDHGLRAVTLAGKVKDHVDAALPYYNHTYYDPMWLALSDRRMAVAFHVGLGREKPRFLYEGTPEEPGWEILFDLDAMRGHQQALLYLLAGGVPERFPGLYLGYVESGCRWIPPLLEELDAYSRGLPVEAMSQFEMLPSEMWSRQGFAAGLMDPWEIENRHVIGVRNLMWGSDLPHVEGTYPHTQEHLDKHFADVPVDEQHAILATNAARVFGFDLEQLATTPAAQQQWPSDES